MDKYEQLKERLADRYSVTELAVLTGKSVETIRNWMALARRDGVSIEMEEIRSSGRIRRAITRQGVIALLRYVQFPVV